LILSGGFTGVILTFMKPSFQFVIILDTKTGERDEQY